MRTALASLTAASMIVLLSASAADRTNGLKEIPCPEPTPNFKASEMDRTLKEPKYGSETPAYFFMALGPQGKQVVAFVADESKGQGKGVDTVYVDLNANRDITEEGECFNLEKTGTMNPMRKGRKAKKAPPAYMRKITGGSHVLSNRKLEIEDPNVSYVVNFGFSFNDLRIRWNDGSYRENWHFVTNWSVDKDKALVIRGGGNEFTLKHEECMGKTLKPGDAVKAEATKPFFAGGNHGGYVHWGNNRMRAWVEPDPDNKEYMLPIPLGRS